MQTMLSHMCFRAIQRFCSIKFKAKTVVLYRFTRVLYVEPEKPVIASGDLLKIRGLLNKFMDYRYQK